MKVIGAILIGLLLLTSEAWSQDNSLGAFTACLTLQHEDPVAYLQYCANRPRSAESDLQFEQRRNMERQLKNQKKMIDLLEEIISNQKRR